MSLLAKRVYFFIAFLVCALIILKAVDYLSPDFSRGFLMGKERIFPFYRFALYAHMLASPIALLIGLFQFSFRRSRWHRALGQVYVVCVVLLAAPSGLVMSFYAIGGLPSVINFIALSSLWGTFTYLAYTSIKAGNLAKHQRMMTRSFILANSAVLIRLFSFVNNSSYLFDPVTGYIIISYISWLPWLLVYEGSLKIRSITADQSNSSHSNPVS